LSFSGSARESRINLGVLFIPLLLHVIPERKSGIHFIYLVERSETINKLPHVISVTNVMSIIFRRFSGNE